MPQVSKTEYGIIKFVDFVHRQGFKNKMFRTLLQVWQGHLLCWVIAAHYRQNPMES
jgi:hypothetical protein